MRRLILGLGVVGVLGVAYALAFRSDAPPTGADVVAAMRANDPSLGTAEVTLNGCRLQVQNVSALSGTDAIAVTELDVDLQIFDFETVQVTMLEDKRQALTFSRAAVTDAMLAQAQALLQSLPQEANVQASDETALENLRELLEQPGAQLRFQTQADVIEDPEGGPAQLKPSPQAPQFFDFVEALRALPLPRTYAAGLTFASSEQSRDSLVSGVVSFPAQLQLRANTVEDARALGETLFRYVNESCLTPSS